jgi:hypothetical protein
MTEHLSIALSKDCMSEVSVRSYDALFTSINNGVLISGTPEEMLRFAGYLIGVCNAALENKKKQAKLSEGLIGLESSSAEQKTPTVPIHGNWAEERGSGQQTPRGIDAANKNRVFAWKGIWMCLRLALMSAGRIWGGKKGFPGQ